MRDAAGPFIAPTVSTIVNSTLNNSTLVSVNTTVLQQGALVKNASVTVATCQRGSCPYGLMNDMQVMELVSAWGPLILAGIFSATLSSALASLVSAPKVFQAVCKDRIFPKIDIFAKGYGKGDEPRRAYFLAYGIAFGFCCIGLLNDIAPIISNFFLMSYTLINYSCFDASLAKSPGWRPAFKYYSMWLSLIGALLCLSVMFIINWWCALITFIVIAFLYTYVHYTKPDVNWGSSTQAHVYRNALTSTLKLINTMDHVKNFRPQVLVLTGFPTHRIALVDFASSITKNVGLMVCGHIILNKSENLQDLRALNKDANECLQKRKVKAFYNVLTAQNMRSGVQSMLQCVGVGKMRPNTMMIGFKSQWSKSSPEDIEEYINIIHDAFDMNLGVGILRLHEGLDCSLLLNETNVEEIEEDRNDDDDESASKRESTPDVRPVGNEAVEIKITDDNAVDQDKEETDSPANSESQERKDTADDDEKIAKAKKAEMKRQESLIKGNSDKINKDILKMINRFNRKQKRGTIDVWWLFDDGGLTLLIPYILSSKSNWSNCKLRVFTAATKKYELDRNHRQMVTLLSKFRIDYSMMEVIPDIGKRPTDDSIKNFRTLIEDWLLDEEKGETSETHPWKISKDEMQSLKDKTYRQIRLRELLLEHSRDASLIVMSLPMPRKGSCSSGLYMAWIDTLTKDMPPILLLRGNQDSVLTYYS